MKIRAEHNSTSQKGGVSCFKESYLVHQTLVFQNRFFEKSHTLRLAANRYQRKFQQNNK